MTEYQPNYSKSAQSTLVLHEDAFAIIQQQSKFSWTVSNIDKLDLCIKRVKNHAYPVTDKFHY